MNFLIRKTYVFLWSLGLLSICDAQSALQHAHISAYVIDTETGKVVFEQNSDKSLIPASCLKIVTTGAALYLLGPDFQFCTALEYDGEIDRQGHLHGNIYIVGDGDPCLGSDRVPPSLSWNQQIEEWCSAISSLGITKILGKVIGDDIKWRKPSAVPSWELEDLPSYYGAGPSALTFHENAYTLYLKSGLKKGDPAHLIRLDLPLSEIRFCNEVTTLEHTTIKDLTLFGAECCPVRYIQGSLPLSKEEFSIRGSIPNPARACANLLKASLTEKNIEVGEQSFLLNKNRRVFHRHFSPYLKDIIYALNQKSINIYAENLTRKIGELKENEGTTQAGVRAIKNFWESQNIEDCPIYMVDGSGLSRKNLITTKQLVSILLKIKNSPYFSVFFNSLPEVQENVRAKSGTMSLVKGYTGYAGKFAFAILVNQCVDAKETKEFMNEFISKLNQGLDSSNPQKLLSINSS